MPLPTLQQFKAPMFRPADAKLRAMEFHDKLRRTDIAEDRNAIAREGLEFNKEKYEFDRKQILFAQSRDFIPSLEKEEFGAYKKWLEGIHPELAKLLPNDVMSLPDDQWNELKAKIEMGTDNFSKMQLEQYKATVKQIQEITEQENRIKLERVKQQKPPGSLAAAWLKNHPNPSDEDIIKFNASMKGKGEKITVGPDGTIMIERGGSSMSTPTKTTLEKEVSEMSSEVMELSEVQNSAFEEILTYQGKAKKLVLNTMDKFGMDVGTDNKEFIGSARVFIENLEQFFNKYRKRITGAQAAMKEIEMLRTSILNKKIGPTEFRSSIENILSKVKKGIRLKRMLLSRGVMDEKVLNDLYASGSEVPDEEMDRRGDELLAGGLSKDQVIEQLRKEGYPIDEEVENAE